MSSDQAPAETAEIAIPKFNNPPVIETILGLHFRPLRAFTIAHQGILWDQLFRERFPKLEEKSVVEDTPEVFGEEPGVPSITWQVSDRPPAPRLWASSEDGQHIVQLQNSAFLTNWIKTDDKVSYRPYKERREEFVASLEGVRRYLEEQDLEKLVPTSAVVTYINHVELEEMSDISPVVAQTTTFWQNKTSDGWLPAPDKLDLQFAFPMPDGSGRLNVRIVPAIRRSDKQRLLRMELTARGKPAEANIGSAMEWIDRGHEWVVRGFASITREKMHEAWGRIQ